MSTFVDPFDELDRKIASDAAKKQARDALVALLKKPTKTEADRAAIDEARKDPLMRAIFDLKQYYELKQTEGSLSDVQRASLATIELKYPGVAKAYYQGKLLAMLLPREYYAQLKSKGIGSREDAFAIADIEAKYPEFKQRTQWKGRRRTGRGRRGHGRRKTTKRR